uniref:Zinc finger, CCHC-type, retrotransposon Gag domain protein n=1 Tax=Tanacetum cinerariifolium TaxID=118510 RepID=A0A699USH2_TANCI|nr:zinc finger, CCHC-type, retrotransposon Gag domain protein [Tanacetum cinerariifolium]
MQRFLRLAGFLGAAVGTEEEQAKNFQWGLSRSTLNHLMYRRSSGDNYRSNNNYSGSNNRNFGYGRGQRNMGQQSNRSVIFGNSS